MSAVRLSAFDILSLSSKVQLQTPKNEFSFIPFFLFLTAKKMICQLLLTRQMLFG